MSSCSYCRASGHPLLACMGACSRTAAGPSDRGSAVYCGEACQLGDWRAGHASVCHIESESSVNHEDGPTEMVESAICDALAHLEVELEEHAEHNPHKIAAIEAHIALGEQLLEEGEHVGLSMDRALDFVGREKLTPEEKEEFKVFKSHTGREKEAKKKARAKATKEAIKRIIKQRANEISSRKAIDRRDNRRDSRAFRQQENQKMKSILSQKKAKAKADQQYRSPVRADIGTGFDLIEGRDTEYTLAEKRQILIRVFDHRYPIGRAGKLKLQSWKEWVNSKLEKYGSKPPRFWSVLEENPKNYLLLSESGLKDYDEAVRRGLDHGKESSSDSDRMSESPREPDPPNSRASWSGSESESYLEDEGSE